MKFFWTFGALFSFLLAFHLGSGYISPSIVRKCVNSTGVNATELALFYATDFRVITTPVKCYIGCLFQSAGFVDNGRITDDFIYMAKDDVETERFKELMKICDSSAAEGECEPNFQAFKCWMINKERKEQNKS